MVPTTSPPFCPFSRQAATYPTWSGVKPAISLKATFIIKFDLGRKVFLAVQMLRRLCLCFSASQTAFPFFFKIKKMFLMQKKTPENLRDTKEQIGVARNYIGGPSANQFQAWNRYRIFLWF